MSIISSSKFDKIGAMVRSKFSRFVKSFNYDLWKEIVNNEIAKSPNPRKAASQWFKDYYRDPKNKYQKRVMRPGSLYAFEYFDPLTKDTLDYWDRQPLSLCLGNIRTKAGEVREVCINFHYLPQKVRMIVMYQVYYLFRMKFKSNLYTEDIKAVPIDWKVIAKPLKQFGVGFCLRMYVPNLKKNVIEIKQEDWCRAVYWAPRDFVGANAMKLETQWREYVKKNQHKLVHGESFS